MEESNKTKKARFDFKKIKPMQYFILLLCVGILIVLSVADPFESEPKVATKDTQTNSNLSMLTDQEKEDTNENSTVSYYEKKLKKLLEKVDGIGSVEVMITLKSSKEQVVLKDTPYTQENLNETDEAGGSRISSSMVSEEETVLVTNKSGETEPYITKEIEAEIEGVVVIAQGGSDGQLALDIISSVEVLFGIPAHKVKVLPMIQ